MTDNCTIESLHSLNSDLNNLNQAQKMMNKEGARFTSENFHALEEKATNDDESHTSPNLIPTSPVVADKQSIGSTVASRALEATQLQSKQSNDASLQQQGYNSLHETGTLDSDSIYTSNQTHDDNKVISTGNDASANSSHTSNKGGTSSFKTPSATAEDEVGSYMSVEVIQPTSLEATPKFGHGHKTTTAPSEPIIQVMEHDNNAQMMHTMLLPEMNHQRPITATVARELGRLTPPNMVMVDEPHNKKKLKPFSAAGSSANSTEGSLYTEGHDASTLTKDTFIKQQDYNYMEEERQAYSIIDPEAPKQEATQDYDAYYDPNAYNATFGMDDGDEDEPSIGHSTITSLTKDTGILRTEQPDDDLPVSRGILTGEDVSYVSPPRIGHLGLNYYSADRNKPGTPSTFVSMPKDEEYGSGAGAAGEYSNNSSNNKSKETGTMWTFLQNATRDPTVQCLISLACIFAVILFFLVAVIIVLTSEDIQL